MAKATKCNSLSIISAPSPWFVLGGILAISPSSVFLLCPWFPHLPLVDNIVSIKGRTHFAWTLKICHLNHVLPLKFLQNGWLEFFWNWVKESRRHPISFALQRTLALTCCPFIFTFSKTWSSSLHFTNLAWALDLGVFGVVLMRLLLRLSLNYSPSLATFLLVFTRLSIESLSCWFKKKKRFTFASSFHRLP